MGALGAAGAQSPGGTEGGLPSNVIRVTEEEKAALERVQGEFPFLCVCSILKLYFFVFLAGIHGISSSKSSRSIFGL